MVILTNVGIIISLTIILGVMFSTIYIQLNLITELLEDILNNIKKQNDDGK